VEFHGPRKPTLASDAEQVYRYLLHTNGLYLPVWQAFREAGVTGRALYAAAANRQALEKLLDMAVVPKWRSAQLVELLTREFATNNQPPLFRTRTVLAAAVALVTDNEWRWGFVQDQPSCHTSQHRRTRPSHKCCQYCISRVLLRIQSTCTCSMHSMAPIPHRPRSTNTSSTGSSASCAPRRPAPLSLRDSPIKPRCFRPDSAATMEAFSTMHIDGKSHTRQ